MNKASTWDLNSASAPQATSKYSAISFGDFRFRASQKIARISRLASAIS